MIRIHIIAFMILLVSLLPLSAEPGLSIEASLEGGGTISVEPGYDAAPGSAFEGRLGIATGAALGFVARAGMAYQSPSSFTADWFRYRGFLGLTLGAGARAALGPLDATLLAGGMLARYDYSYSYFWFPYVELGVGIPVIQMGQHFALKAGASIPLYLRADAFTMGLRAVLTVAFMPNRRADAELPNE